MKNIVLFMIAVCCAMSCDKVTCYDDTVGITGSWKLVALHDWFNGSNWVEVEPSASHTITFTSDDRFIDPDTAWYGTKRYVITGTDGLKLIKDGDPDAEYSMQFSLEDRNATLLLTPPCIEGCQYKYAKLN